MTTTRITREQAQAFPLAESVEIVQLHGTIGQIPYSTTRDRFLADEFAHARDFVSFEGGQCRFGFILDDKVGRCFPVMIR